MYDLHNKATLTVTGLIRFPGGHVSPGFLCSILWSAGSQSGSFSARSGLPARVRQCASVGHFGEEEGRPRLHAVRMWNICCERLWGARRRAIWTAERRRRRDTTRSAASSSVSSSQSHDKSSSERESVRKWVFNMSVCPLMHRTLLNPSKWKENYRRKVYIADCL